jgi:hypothetical protein
MFYTTISYEGYGFTPLVQIVDAENFKNSYSKDDIRTIVLTETITRKSVAKLLDRANRKWVAIKHNSAQEAFDLALAIYTKMPRWNRELGFMTNPKNPDFVTHGNMNSRGVGAFKSEVARKYC